MALFDEGNRVGVFGNAVEPCAVFRSEGFEFVQCACFFKHFGVKLDGGHGAEHAGAAAGVFFGGFGVRRGVGTEEEFVRLLAGNGGNQCLTVGLAFEYGQAEMMGAHAADQEVVTVEQEVLRGHGGGNVVACFQNQAGGFGGGDVFEHDFEIWHLCQNGFHHAPDKGGFAVEDVDFGVGYFAVNEEQDALFCHFFQNGDEFEQVGYAGIGIGRRACGVEFEGDDAGGFGFAHQLGRGLVGQVKRHQRRKRAAFGQRRHDARFVGKRVGNADDGWFEVGHDDGAPHLAGGIGSNGFERVAVAQVQVHIVGADDGQGLHGCSLFGRAVSGFRRPERMTRPSEKTVWLSPAPVLGRNGKPDA